MVAVAVVDTLILFACNFIIASCITASVLVSVIVNLQKFNWGGQTETKVVFCGMLRKVTNLLVWHQG